MNEKKLKAKMIEHGDTQQMLADAMGISLSRLNAKINSTKADFRQNEIKFISSRYGFSSEEIDEIFLLK